MKIYFITIVLLSFLFPTTRALADGFFNIDKITYYKTRVSNGPELYKDVPVLDKAGKPTKQMQHVFIPCLSMLVKTLDSVRWSSTMFAAHFYDKNKKLIETVNSPTSNLGLKVDPFVTKKQQWTELLLAVPDAIIRMQSNEWTVVVVFGDKQSAAAKTWPIIPLGGLDYPEKALVEKKGDFDRTEIMDPVVDQVVKTGNPQYEQFTLFMRPPKGVTHGKDVRGVMAIGVLAEDPQRIRNYLLGSDVSWEYSYTLDFADKNKFAIIAWGSHRLWNPTKNWDEQDKKTNTEMDKSFDKIAMAWSKGVEIFIEKYGIPKKDYLLWGTSGSAQFSCRLALRKPEYFLAIHAHTPSSFDAPTLGGNQVLWCLTTGELESGYERSLRFYAKCRQLGYPMIYKAFIGLGHATSPLADDLGLKFFEYALSVRDKRDELDARSSHSVLRSQDKNANTPLQPWLETFCSPEFVGDIVNQEVFPLAQVDQVPAGFRVSLPTKELADAWNKK